MLFLVREYTCIFLGSKPIGTVDDPDASPSVRPCILLWEGIPIVSNKDQMDKFTPG